MYQVLDRDDILTAFYIVYLCIISQPICLYTCVHVRTVYLLMVFVCMYVYIVYPSPIHVLLLNVLIVFLYIYIYICVVYPTIVFVCTDICRYSIPKQYARMQHINVCTERMIYPITEFA